MKKGKTICAVSLTACMLLLLLFSACSCTHNGWERNPETGKYEFTADPDTWSSLDRGEQEAACRIPEDIVSELSTEELAELLLQYPLLTDFYAYDTFADAVAALSEALPLETLFAQRAMQAYAQAVRDGEAVLPENPYVEDQVPPQFLSDAVYYEWTVYGSGTEYAAWERNPVTGKYEYPTTINSPEWAELDHAERVDACRIPEDVAAELTEEETVELVLTYPLLLDVLAYNSFPEGVETVSAYFPQVKTILTNGTLAAYVESHTDASGSPLLPGDPDESAAFIMQEYIRLGLEYYHTDSK